MDALAAAVADGTLAPGAALPPQRALAHALGLSLGTVTRAYDEARRRGLLEGERGRGTFVCRPDGAAARDAAYFQASSSGMVDLGLNLPVPGPADRRLPDALEELSRDGRLAARFGRGVPGADPRHAEAGARWLARLGLAADPARTLVTVGGQHALLVAFMAAAVPGAAVLVEPHTFPPVRQIARHLQLPLHPVTVDSEGVLPEALDQACRATRARVAYLMPTLQSPTTATMSATRRAEVAAVVVRHGLTVIEDDVYGHLPARRPAPLAEYAPGHCMLVGGLSKSIAPWLRVGYLHVPERLATAARNAVAMSCWSPPPFGPELATRWIDDGSADAMLAWQRAEVAARQAIARSALGERAAASSRDGLHLWLRLPPGFRPAAFQAAAERAGVRVVASATFAVAGDGDPAIRLGLGNPATREELRRGVEAVARLLAEGPADEGIV